jgi:cell division protein FtsB
MALPKPNRNQIALGVALALIVVVIAGIAWAFGRQILLSRQLRAEERRMEQLLEAEQETHEALTATLEYAQSDAYVEQWARTEAKLAKPGEIVVIPPHAEDSAIASETPTPEENDPGDPPFWVKWWRSVFKSQNHP